MFTVCSSNLCIVLNRVNPNEFGMLIIDGELLIVETSLNRMNLRYYFIFILLYNVYMEGWSHHKMPRYGYVSTKLQRLQTMWKMKGAFTFMFSHSNNFPFFGLGGNTINSYSLFLYRKNLYGQTLWLLVESRGWISSCNKQIPSENANWKPLLKAG